MGRTKSCRICRTEKNLKYNTKELRQLNKKQILLAQASQQGQTSNRASKKLLLTTPTLGNICQVCDERIQIFHRLDDGGHESSSDVEIEVATNISQSLPTKLAETFSNVDLLQRTQRPETPVIVDDDDMLFNIFMQKFEHKAQAPPHQLNSSSQHHQEKQFTNQFHSTYTPPQSSGGGSEGDESKVIEILTSRESTPAPKQHFPVANSNSAVLDPQGHRIVAIIELDDNDDNDQDQTNEAERPIDLSVNVTSPLNNEHNDRRSVLPPIEKSNFKSFSMQETYDTNVVEDDDEIVFCKVDNEKEKQSTLKKKKRKNYDEKELRLVASLNLISSDSEEEDSQLNSQMSQMPSVVVTEPPPTVINKSFNCSDCQLKFPDFESLAVHERSHQGVKCILCTIAFQQVKRLIHHMRRKHREYNGDALSEKPRSGQDSCMTIRLRYMQHTTFYECQLCGRIDDVFREHKEHIIDKHPNESKSLKDPIMKQLKCPVCKAKCGAQYLSLCRHLVSTHEYQEYKSHLRELVHVSAFGWNATRQQEVAKTAKIFQFIKRKTFFFECKICCKVVAGYLHHIRHANEHKNLANNETKVEINPRKDIVPSKAPSSTMSSLHSSNLNKLCQSLKNDEVCISSNMKRKDVSSQKLICHTNLTNETKQIEKVVKISKKMRKPKTNHVLKSNFNTRDSGITNKVIKTAQSKKSEAGAKSETGKKLQIKNTCKPKHKEVAKFTNDIKLTKGKSKSEISKKDNKKLKDKSAKVKDVEVKAQVKKIKVKTLVRQIDLQKYKCKYCLKKYKGFRFYNLHLLRHHKENEYNQCNKCNKLYASSSKYKEHIKQCQVIFTSKRKRKLIKESPLSKILAESIETCVKKVPKNDDLEDNYLWLKELLKLREPLNINDNNFNFHQSPKTALFYSQCCYCLHLFANDKELQEHKENHHYENLDILLRYKPLRKT